MRIAPRVTLVLVEQILMRLVIIIPALECPLGDFEEFFASNALDVTIAKDDTIPTAVPRQSCLDHSRTRSKIGTFLEIMLVDVDDGPAVETLFADRDVEIGLDDAGGVPRQGRVADCDHV